MRPAVVALLIAQCGAVFAQPVARLEDAMRAWVRGDFLRAEILLAAERDGPIVPDLAFAGTADFEIERGNYGAALEYLELAKRYRTWATGEAVERRYPLLYLQAGQYARAEEGSRALRAKGTIRNFVIAEILRLKGELAVAEPLLVEVKNQTRKGRTESFEWIRASNSLALLHLQNGNTRTAQANAEGAVARAAQEWGAPSIPYADSQDTLGLVFIKQGDLPRAEIALTQARLFRERIYSPTHPKIAESYLHLAMLQAERGDSAAAFRSVRRSMDVQRAASPGGLNGRWALALVTAGEVLERIARPEDAAMCYESAIPVLDVELGSDAAAVRDARSRLASLAPK